jgi:pimeloyl-ACP methyl ester carboxylesterase
VTSEVEFIDVDWPQGPSRIEYRWIGNAGPDRPLVVFLHEGLGSLAMWKDFPGQLCEAANCRGLVYSRPGYGKSSPRAADEKWPVEFMHRQAYDLLPALLAALGVDAGSEPPWLLGHSDGGSIALLYAAKYSSAVAGLIVLSPHIMVEDVTIDSIERARQVYLQTDLKDRLGRYHDDPDSAFWGWDDVWLSPGFRQWTIERELEMIRCPLLAVQGIDDEYGTLLQIDGIRQRARQTRLAKLADCGHSPHRDQPQRLIELSVDFIAAQTRADADSRAVCSAG